MTDTAEPISDLVQRAVDALSSESQDDPHELIDQLGARAEAAEARVAAQAQEIEQTKRMLFNAERLSGDRLHRAEAAEARVRELENTSAMRTIYEVLAERDAIEAATIERCIAIGEAVAVAWQEGAPGDELARGRAYGALDVCNRLRALAKEPAAAPPVPSVT
jgi:hypothetical protein